MIVRSWEVAKLLTEFQFTTYPRCALLVVVRNPGDIVTAIAFVSTPCALRKGMGGLNTTFVGWGIGLVVPLLGPLNRLIPATALKLMADRTKRVKKDFFMVESLAYKLHSVASFGQFNQPFRKGWWRCVGFTFSKGGLIVFLAPLVVESDLMRSYNSFPAWFSRSVRPGAIEPRPFIGSMPVSRLPNFAHPTDAAASPPIQISGPL